MPVCLYAAPRSALAKSIGLGRKPKEVAPAPVKRRESERLGKYFRSRPNYRLLI
jgi:hypothetical protein